jgi:hypothetical protein
MRRRSVGICFHRRSNPAYGYVFVGTAFRAGIDPQLQERGYNWGGAIVAMQVAGFATIDIPRRVPGPTMWAIPIEGHGVRHSGISDWTVLER